MAGKPFPALMGGASDIFIHVGVTKQFILSSPVYELCKV